MRRLHDPSLSRGVETTTRNRPDLAASQPALRLFANSETNPACRRMVFSRSVSESLSQTIRIRAPSGTSQLIAPTVLIAHLDSYAIYSLDARLASWPLPPLRLFLAINHAGFCLAHLALAWA